MSEIVERLRAPVWPKKTARRALCDEAADHIEALMAALRESEAALATLRDKVRVLGEFAETTTEPNMVGVPAMVLTEALALLAPSGNGEKP